MAKRSAFDYSTVLGVFLQDDTETNAERFDFVCSPFFYPKHTKH